MNPRPERTAQEIKELNDALLTAVANDDVEKAAELLMRGAEVDVVNDGSMMWFQIAIKQKNRKMMELLLRNGWDVNVKDQSGRISYFSPLFRAVTLHDVDLLNFLLHFHESSTFTSMKVNINAISNLQTTALQVAISLAVSSEWSDQRDKYKEIMHTLLDAGADVDADAGIFPVIKSALALNDVEILQKILDKTKHKMLFQTFTPEIRRLIASDNIPLMTLLLKHLDKQQLSSKDTQSISSVLLELNPHAKTEQMKKLIKQSHELLSNKYMVLSYIRNPSELVYATVDMFEKYITYFPKNSHPEPDFYDKALNIAHSKSKYNYVLSLLKAGANPNYVFSPTYTCSLLNREIVNGKVSFVETLIQAGADVNQESSYSTSMLTPLMTAVVTGNIDVVRVLLKYKADVNKLSSIDGSAALHYVLDMHYIAPHKHRNAIPIVQALLAAGADVNLSVKGKGSPLTRILSIGKSDIARLLIDAGADVKATDIGNGNSALIVAATFCSDLDLIRLLLSKGADVNYCHRNGSSALTIAIDDNRGDLICLLIEAGADLTQQINGKSLVDYATHASTKRLLQTAIDKANAKKTAPDVLKRITNAYAELPAKEGVAFVQALIQIHEDEIHYKTLTSEEPELDEATVITKAYCLSGLNKLLNQIKALFAKEFSVYSTSFLLSNTTRRMSSALTRITRDANLEDILVAKNISELLMLDSSMKGGTFHSAATDALNNFTCLQLEPVKETPGDLQSDVYNPPPTYFGWTSDIFAQPAAAVYPTGYVPVVHVAGYADQPPPYATFMENRAKSYATHAGVPTQLPSEPATAQHASMVQQPAVPPVAQTPCPRLFASAASPNYVPTLAADLAAVQAAPASTYLTGLADGWQPECAEKTAAEMHLQHAPSAAMFATPKYPTIAVPKQPAGKQAPKLPVKGF